MIIAIVVVVFSETIGLWFINNKIVIPDNRQVAAHMVYQMSIITTFIGITQVPYNASLIAHEKFDVYTLIEIVNVLLKLVILYLIILQDCDKLILYGFLLLVVSLLVSMYYRFYGFKHFEECKIKRVWKMNILKPMLTFSIWDLYGNMSVTARTQGVNILLNIFFGPIMNAAAGIAVSVQGAVTTFATNITTAIRPQIIKFYAQGDYDEMSSLIYNACRCVFFVMAILVIPLCGEIKYVLTLWLGNYPEETPVFCILTLWFSVFSNLSYVVTIGIHAYGNIKRLSFINGTLYLLVVPISYIAYFIGCEAWVAFLINLITVAIGLIFNVYSLHHYINKFSVSCFFRDVLFRCIVLVVIGYSIVWLTTNVMEQCFLRLLLTIFSSIISLGSIGWFFLLSKNFRNEIIKSIKNICKT